MNFKRYEDFFVIVFSILLVVSSLFAVRYFDSEDVFDARISYVNNLKAPFYIILEVDNKVDISLDYDIEVIYKRGDLVVASDYLSCKSSCETKLELKRAFFDNYQVVLRARYEGRYYEKKLDFSLEQSTPSFTVEMSKIYFWNPGSNLKLNGRITSSDDEERRYIFDVFPTKSPEMKESYEWACSGSCDFVFELSQNIIFGEYTVNVYSQYDVTKTIFEVTSDFNEFQNVSTSVTQKEKKPDKNKNYTFDEDGILKKGNFSRINENIRKIKPIFDNRKVGKITEISERIEKDKYDMKIDFEGSEVSLKNFNVSKLKDFKIDKSREKFGTDIVYIDVGNESFDSGIVILEKEKGIIESILVCNEFLDLDSVNFLELNDSVQDNESEILGVERDSDFVTSECPSGWVNSQLEFEQNDTHVWFETTHFSAYTGTLFLFNPQSYPVVGGTWKVEFNTSGTADLWISASNGTNWSRTSTENTDLQFMNILCGTVPVDYEWINNSVYVQNYSCNEKSYEISKVLTGGVHTKKFQFGVDVGYAHNFATSRGSGFIVYSNSADQSIPRYRVWDPDSFSWSAAMNAIDVTENIEEIQVACSVARHECALLTVDSGDDVEVQFWNNKCWSDGTTCGQTYTLETTTNGEIGKRANMKYEQDSGDLLVVWSSNADDGLQYRVWDGSSWSSEGEIKTDLGGTLVTTGTPEWIELAQEPGTDNISMVYRTSINEGGVAVYNGEDGTFGCQVDSGNRFTSLSNYVSVQNVDIEYEQISGDLFAVGGTTGGSGSEFMYITKASGTCTYGSGTATNIDDDSSVIKIAPVWGSDYIIIHTKDQGANDNDLTAWNGNTELLDGTGDTGLEAEVTGNQMLGIACPKDMTTDTCVATYPESNNAALSYQTYTPSTNTWAPGSTPNRFSATPAMSSGGHDVTYCVPYPFSDDTEIMCVVEDDADDLWAKVFESSTGTFLNSEGGSALETNLRLSEYKASNFNWVIFDSPYPPVLVEPVNYSTNNPVNINLSVDVSDPNGDDMTIAFYWSNGTPILGSNLNWYGDFDYRRQINLSMSSGTTAKDYQFNIRINSSNVGSNFNWARTCNDVRFTNTTNKLLSYWIESCSSSNQNASIWVKIPVNLSTTVYPIYMYYGSSSSTNISNGGATFDFFDNFQSGLSKWTMHKNAAGITNTGGYVEMGGGTTTSPYGHSVLGSDATYTEFLDGIIEGDIYFTTNSIAEIGVRGNFASNTGYKSRIDARTSQGLSHLKPPYFDGTWDFLGSCTTSVTSPSLGVWVPFKLTAVGTSLTIESEGETKTCTDSEFTTAGEISLQNHYGPYTRYDNIRVRKYATGTQQRVINIEETIPFYASGSTVTAEVENLDYLTSYDWYVVASDGKYSTTSDIWRFTTKDRIGTIVPTLNVPSTSGMVNVLQNKPFKVNVTIECVGEGLESCFNVSAWVQYNDSSSTYNNVSYGAGSPFYTTVSQPQWCILDQGESCSLQWDVYPTATTDTKHLLNVFTKSNRTTMTTARTLDAMLNITPVPPPSVFWSTSSIDMGSGLLYNGNLTGATSISIVDNHTGVTVSCIGGDCTRIVDDFVDGLDYDDSENPIVTFKCLEDTVGIFNANFSVVSNEDITDNEIAIYCQINQTYGVLDLTLSYPPELDQINLSKNELFNIYANVSCIGTYGALCGDIILYSLRSEDLLGLEWWDENYPHRRVIQVTESSALTRTNVPITVNVSGLQDIDNCLNDTRIVSNWSGTQQEIKSQILSGDNNTWCEYVFIGNVSSGATNEGKYFVYYGYDSGDPSYVSDISSTDTAAGWTLSNGLISWAYSWTGARGGGPWRTAITTPSGVSLSSRAGYGDDGFQNADVFSSFTQTVYGPVYNEFELVSGMRGTQTFRVYAQQNWFEITNEFITAVDLNDYHIIGIDTATAAGYFWYDTSTGTGMRTASNYFFVTDGANNRGIGVVVSGVANQPFRDGSSLDASTTVRGWYVNDDPFYGNYPYWVFTADDRATDAPDAVTNIRDDPMDESATSFGSQEDFRYYPISTVVGTSPMYTTDSQPQYCNGLISGGANCSSVWGVFPVTRGQYRIKVNASSDLSQISSTVTEKSTVLFTWPDVYLQTPSNASTTLTLFNLFYANFTSDWGLENATLYVWNQSGYLLDTNYSALSGTYDDATLGITLPGDGMYLWNYLACDIYSGCAFNNSNFTLFIDSTPPTVNLVSPTDNDLVEDLIIQFVVNVSDNVLLGNATLYIWNQSGSLVGTNFTTLSGLQQEFNLTYDIPEGIYIWNYLVSDAAGNSNWADSNYSFIYDKYVPQINFTYPTEGNNSFINRFWSLINVTVNDSLSTSSYIDFNNSLLVYLNFENSSGVTIYDKSGNSNDGTLVNNAIVNIANKIRGSNVLFDGDDDYVLVSTINNNNIVDEMTLEVWIYPYTLNCYSAQDCTIVNGGPASDMQFTTNDNLDFRFCTQYATSCVTVPISDLTVDKWQHVAGVWDGSNCYLYIDGVLKGQDVCAGIVVPTSLYIGQHTAGARAFNGSMDEVKLWSRALSSQEINASINSKYNSLFRNFTSISQGSYNYNACAIDMSGKINCTETRILNVDVTSPLATLQLPVNETFTSNAQIDFEGNFSDEFSGLKNATLYLFNSSGGVVVTNSTNLSGMTDNASLRLTIAQEGYYLWNYLVYDNAGNYNWSIHNFSIQFDLTKPKISLNTPYNGTLSQSLDQSFNGNFTDDIRLKNATLYVWNASGGNVLFTNFTTLNTADANITFNITFIGEGTYLWNYLVYDSAGNYNWSNQNNSLTIDFTPPIVNLTKPIDNASTNDYSLQFIGNFSDSLTSLKNATLYIWNSTNDLIFTNATNLTSFIDSASLWYTFSDGGTYHWNYLVYDSAGNSNFSYKNYTYIIDISKPHLEFVPPSDGDNDYVNRHWTMINVSVFDTSNVSSYIDFNNKLKLYLNYENVSGAIISDFSSYNNDGTNVGASSSSNNHIRGTYFDFSNSGDYIEVSPDSSLDLTGPFTISAWINASSLGPADYQSIINKEDSGGASNDRNFWLSLWGAAPVGSAHLRFSTSSSSTDCDVGGSSDLRDDKWHHLTGVYNGTHCMVYVDGVIASTPDSVIGVPQGQGDSLRIGDEQGVAGRGFVGSIDEIMVFERALTQTEIYGLYEGKTQGVSGNFSFNKNGVYSYNACAIDEFGNFNCTAERVVNINKTIPEITILNPLNGSTYGFNQFIPLNITTLIEANNSWFEVDNNGTIFSMTKFSTFNWGEILLIYSRFYHNISFYADDEVGNIANKNTTIYIVPYKDLYVDKKIVSIGNNSYKVVLNLTTFGDWENYSIIDFIDSNFTFYNVSPLYNDSFVVLGEKYLGNVLVWNFTLISPASQSVSYYFNGSLDHNLENNFVMGVE